MNKKYLYGWVTTYNPFENIYLAANRDNYHKLFSDIKDESVLKSSTHEALEEVIMKCEGDLHKILKLIETWT